MRAEERIDRWGSDFLDIFYQFGFVVSPSKICIRLRKADLAQMVHHIRPREGFGEEDDFGMTGPHIAD